MTEILKDLPTLATERLLIRRLTMEDAQDMFEYAQDPEIAGLGLWLPQPTLEDSLQDLTETLEAYERGHYMSWAMELKAEGKMIGRIGLSAYSPRSRRAELGYALNRNYWGKGYASEAVGAVLEFGFRTVGLHRIEANALPENAASIRVLEKVGMNYEGKRRECTFIRGKFDDLNLYGLLEQDFNMDDSSNE